jgi:hypothetical protein
LLSELIQNIGDECGYDVETTSIRTSNHATTKQLFRMANRVLGKMARAYNWRALWGYAEIELVDGQSRYPAPADFSFYHYDTFWNVAEKVLLYDLSPQELSELEVADSDPSVVSNFQISGISHNQILIYPPPTSDSAGQTVSLRYSRARYARPKEWESSESITVGDYRFYDGNYYKATTSGTTGEDAPVHTSSTASDGGVTWLYYEGKYERFIADTDEPNLSQDVLEQGVMERFGSIKELKVAASFDADLEAEFAKQNPAQILSATGGGGATRVQYAESGKIFFRSR